MYAEELVDSLLECMWCLSGPDTHILLAYYERGAAAHRRFWRAVPTYFLAARKVPEDSYGASKHPAGAGLFVLHRRDAVCTDQTLQSDAGLPTADLQG